MLQGTLPFQYKVVQSRDMEISSMAWSLFLLRRPRRRQRHDPPSFAIWLRIVLFCCCSSFSYSTMTVRAFALVGSSSLSLPFSVHSVRSLARKRRVANDNNNGWSTRTAVVRQLENDTFLYSRRRTRRRTRWMRHVRSALFGTSGEDHQALTTTTRSTTTDATPTATNATARRGNMEQPSFNYYSSTSLLQCGLVFSSFTNGLRLNEDAQEFLKRGLIQSLLRQRQAMVEASVQESAMQSPCCGPDVTHLEQLTWVDEQLRQVWTHPQPWTLFGQGSTTREEEKKMMMQDLNPFNPPNVQEVRVVYIPTALYALRPESNNTPGKQRQRARADAMSRRTILVHWLHDQQILPCPLPQQSTLPDEDREDSIAPPMMVLSIVTVDLDDDSVKQPHRVMGQVEQESRKVDDDLLLSFPETGHDALQDWQPHLIYVEGGNTFWLHHCLDKGGYRPVLTHALSSSSAPVYCGSSAGAIVVGACVETACWKGWDNPKVVPGRELSEQWQNVPGLNLLPRHASIFPHMSPEWNELVAQKTKEWNKKETNTNLVCLHDDEVWCIGGDGIISLSANFPCSA